MIVYFVEAIASSVLLLSATEKLGERRLCFLYRARITRADQITMLVDIKCGFRSVLVDSRNSMYRISFFLSKGKLIFLQIHFVDDFIVFALCSLFPLPQTQRYERVARQIQFAVFFSAKMNREEKICGMKCTQLWAHAGMVGG